MSAICVIIDVFIPAASIVGMTVLRVMIIAIPFLTFVIINPSGKLIDPIIQGSLIYQKDQNTYILSAHSI